MKSYDTLKNYKGVISIEDYQLLKKELKILRTYRHSTKLFSLDNTTSITGEFFIGNNNDEFDYFRKNEYLPREEKENGSRNK